MIPLSSKPTTAGILIRRESRGTHTMIAMAMANFARVGNAKACERRYSARCDKAITVPDR